MRFSSKIGGLIVAGLLSLSPMAAMPRAFAASPPERPGHVVAAGAQRLTLQQIAQIPRPRAPNRVIYSAKPELR